MYIYLSLDITFMLISTIMAYGTQQYPAVLNVFSTPRRVVSINVS